MSVNIIDYPFVGALAEHLKDFVSEKRAVGRKYNTEAKKLYEFSRVTEHIALDPRELSEETVDFWLAKRPVESNRNQYLRFGVIKQFAEYMQRLGYSAYVPSSYDIGKLRRDFIPRIFTYDEISRLFSVIDSLEKQRFSWSPRLHIMMPLIFRLLYCCGLRVSEVVALRIDDVDTQSGILNVVNSKHGKSRYIPLTPELTEKLAKYMSDMPKNVLITNFLFEAPNGGAYSENTIYSRFREYLYKAKIPHLGKGKGPRLHDLRHSFAVHCLEKWVRNRANA